MTDLKRSIFCYFADKGQYQFTRGDDGSWLLHVTSAPAGGRGGIRWLYGTAGIDDDYVRAAIERAEVVYQYD